MTDLFHWITDANNSGAFELSLQSGAQPLMRTARGWLPMQGAAIAPTWLRENLFAHISNTCKKQLAEQNFCSGEMDVRTRGFAKLEFTVTKTQQGLHVFLSWQKNSADLLDYNLSPVVFEILNKNTGLNLICGPRGGGKTTLVQLLINDVVVNGGSVAVFDEQSEELTATQTGVVRFSADLLAQAYQVTRGFDLVVVDSQRSQHWRSAVQLAEAGVRVLMTMPMTGLRNALLRLSERIEASPEIGFARIAAITQFALEARLVNGMESRKQPVHELLLIDKSIRSLLEQKDWAGIAHAMQAGGEKSGMRTLNQCLMNLMLKRKIDLKVGFAESPEPDQLDGMLERIGF